VTVDTRTLDVDDGDTVMIRWPQDREAETVRLLGIDCPETRHIEHDIPYEQAFGAFKEMKRYKFGSDFLHREFKDFVYRYGADWLAQQPRNRRPPHRRPEDTERARLPRAEAGLLAPCHPLLSAQGKPALRHAHLVLGVDRGEKPLRLQERRHVFQRETQRTEFRRVEMNLVVSRVVVVLHDGPA